MRAWLLCLVWGAGLLPAVAEPAIAEDIGALYQAYAIVTGTDMRQRPWGMAQCLREVLVKVSGDPLLKDDPRTAELAAHADRLVASFDYVDMMAGIPKKDDQGSYDRPHRLTAISTRRRSTARWPHWVGNPGEASGPSWCRCC
jgi:uncharacterized protein